MPSRVAGHGDRHESGGAGGDERAEVGRRLDDDRRAGRGEPAQAGGQRGLAAAHDQHVLRGVAAAEPGGVERAQRREPLGGHRGPGAGAAGGAGQRVPERVLAAAGRRAGSPWRGRGRRAAAGAAAPPARRRRGRARRARRSARRSRARRSRGPRRARGDERPLAGTRLDDAARGRAGGPRAGRSPGRRRGGASARARRAAGRPRGRPRPRPRGRGARAHRRYLCYRSA